jgi:hypothetical protein
LITVPNSFLISNPVQVTRSSGTIISGDVSLGYDVPREKVEELLKKAAENAGLREPFVYVIQLGDFSILYRVYGLLEDVKYVLSAQSTLKKMMLDALHHGGVEIVSPNFMNQRAIPEEKVFTPPHTRLSRVNSEEDYGPETEALSFDKAEQAESIEKIREKRDAMDAEMEKARRDIKEAETAEEKQELKTRIAALEGRKKWLEELIKIKDEQRDGEE